jgi:hypothetical protein
VKWFLHQGEVDGDVNSSTVVGYSMRGVHSEEGFRYMGELGSGGMGYLTAHERLRPSRCLGISCAIVDWC